MKRKAITEICGRGRRQLCPIWVSSDDLWKGKICTAHKGQLSHTWSRNKHVWWSSLWRIEYYDLYEKQKNTQINRRFEKGEL